MGRGAAGPSGQGRRTQPTWVLPPSSSPPLPFSPAHSVFRAFVVYAHLPKQATAAPRSRQLARAGHLFSDTGPQRHHEGPALCNTRHNSTKINNNAYPAVGGRHPATDRKQENTAGRSPELCPTLFLKYFVWLSSGWFSASEAMAGFCLGCGGAAQASIVHSLLLLQLHRCFRACA